MSIRIYNDGLADAIAALGIAAQDSVPVVCNALAGLDAEEIVDAAAFAADLRHALAGTALPERLAPVVSVAVDGGGLDLDHIAADVRLSAFAETGGAMFEIGVGGDAARATNLGAVAPSDSVAAVVRLLDVIAQRGRTARARDVIATGGVAAFHEAVAGFLLGDAPRDRPRASRQAIGAHKLYDGSLAIGIGLPFGHTNARTLERLADVAATLGASGVRPPRAAR